MTTLLNVEVGAASLDSELEQQLPESKHWHSINWLKAHQNVRRLQTRIVKATQQGRWGKVKALQRLLTLLAVKPLLSKELPKIPDNARRGLTANAGLLRKRKENGSRAIPQPKILPASASEASFHPEK